MNPVQRFKQDTLMLAIGLTVALGLPSMAALAAQETALDEMLEEIDRLKRRIEVLEARLEEAISAREPSPGSRNPIAANEPSRKRSGTDPDTFAKRIEIGGRVKLDTIYNSQSAGPDSSNKADVAFDPSAIPVSGNGEDDQVKFSARNSRLWLKAVTPSPLGDIAAYAEMDFFASNTSGSERATNGHTPRLRHAYGEWRGWLGGQTYSTFMDLTAFPEINDDNAPAGAILIRQPMVRWTNSWQRHELQLALESPDSSIRLQSGPSASPDDDRAPDFVVKYVRRHARGHWAIAGLLREVRIDDNVFDGAAIGWGIAASGLIRAGERDELRMVANAGNGLGRYLSVFDDARVDRKGDLELIYAGGGYLAYRHWWTPRWRSNLVLGAAWMDDGGALADENEAVYSLHANLLWSPMLSTTLGLEWIHGERQLVSGRDGVLDRLQFTAVHKF
jgi:hypothetical protein